MSVALPDVAVLALGAHTSLGALVPAAAAVRAGIASGQELDLAAFGLPPREAEGARAHPMPELAPTLGGLDRLLAVALPGVGDLRRELAERKLGLGRTGLYLGLGRPAPADAPLTDRVSKAVADALATPIPTLVETRVFAEGRAGTISALAAAVADLASGQVDHAVVGGVETKLDPARVVAAFDAGRLKTTEQPVGFMPGEASAWVLLEAPATTRARGLAPLALVSAPATALEERSRDAGGPAAGKALGDVVGAALAMAGADAIGSVWVDLNGETYRASDWAMAVVRARRHAPSGLDKLALELPLAFVGDVGAAYPLLALAFATRAFVRGYAPGAVAIVCSSSDAGPRAAIVTRAPAPEPGAAPAPAR